MGSTSPLPGTAGSQEGLRGEPLPWRLLPGTLGEAHSSYETGPRSSETRPPFFHPPSSSKETPSSQARKAKCLFTSWSVHESSPGSLPLQACSFLAQKQAGGRGLGTLGLSLGASTPSPHAGAWTWRSRPSPRAKPASGWRLQGQKTRVKSRDAREAPDKPLDEPPRAAHPSRLWRPSGESRRSWEPQ